MNSSNLLYNFFYNYKIKNNFLKINYFKYFLEKINSTIFIHINFDYITYNI